MQAQGASARGRKPTILLVDDDADTLVTYQLLLLSYGFSVITASSAGVALQRIAESAPDLIITDLTMPWMDGVELCRALRASADTRLIPIILYTAMELAESAPTLYDAFLTKPAEPEALIDAIRTLLPRSLSQT